MPDPTVDARRREELVAAFVKWTETHDDSVEWAWVALDDAIWWLAEPTDMLALIVDVVDRLAGNRAALEEVGAGPLEDLLGGDPEVMMQAEEVARTNAAFRTALSNVTEVKHNQPGFERLKKIVEEAD